MASIPKSGFQDMPPVGGYNPIQTQRIHLRRIVNPWVACGLTIGATVFGWLRFYHDYRNMRREEVELRSARNALLPLLMAERDRIMLKQTLKNREEEKELMQDYPDWEVGTYFGEKIYNWTKPETFIEQDWTEYTAHAHPALVMEKSVRSLLV